MAERRDARDEQGQGQDLPGQVERSGLHVLGEQEQPQQAGGQRVDDRETRLGCGQRPGGQRVRGQQQGGRTRAHQDVRRPVRQHRAEAVAQVRAELLDHRGDEAPGDPGGGAEHRGPAGQRGTGPPARRRPPPAPPPRPPPRPARPATTARQARAGPARRRRGDEQEQAEAGAHGHGRHPVPPPDRPGPDDGHVAEDEDQLEGQDRASLFCRLDLRNPSSRFPYNSSGIAYYALAASLSTGGNDRCYQCSRLPPPSPSHGSLHTDNSPLGVRSDSELRNRVPGVVRRPDIGAKNGSARFSQPICMRRIVLITSTSPTPP